MCHYCGCRDIPLIKEFIAEHRELDAFLTDLDLDEAAHRTAFVSAVSELHDHIAKEEDGLFPASLTELTGEQWDRAMAARRGLSADGTAHTP